MSLSRAATSIDEADFKCFLGRTILNYNAASAAVHFPDLVLTASPFPENQLQARTLVDILFLRTNFFCAVVSTLLNFVKMFNKAHDENLKQIEFEKKKAEKEAENERLKMAKDSEQHVRSPRKFGTVK